MKVIKILLVIILVIQLGLVCFTNRSLYTSKFDADYWRDKYDHSQWKLLYSNRPIGDDGLYLYEGYRLIRGGDPTTFNAEMPPLGKYLIGMSIIIFGNGYIFGLIATTLAILTCYGLFIAVTEDTLLSLAMVAILAFDPLILEQFSLTMLDSLQLLFFCGFLGSLTLALKSAKHRLVSTWSMASGVSLGLFAATKFPMLTPIFALFAIALIWKSKKRWMPIILFLVSALLAYLAPYIPYFTMHHTLMDWIFVQKFMASFYIHSKLPSAIGSVFTTLFVNKNINLFTHAYEHVSQWSPMWPIITIASLWLIVRDGQSFRQNKYILNNMPILGSVFVLLFFYAVIPFWTRYLIILLPLLYLSFGLMIQKTHRSIRLFIITIGVCINIFASIPVFFPPPDSTVKQFVSDWKQGLFQDMYESVTYSAKQSMTRSVFYKTGKQFFYDAQIEDVEFITNIPRWNSSSHTISVPIKITYKTRNLGSIHTETRLPFIKERGQWRAAWQWDMLFPGLKPGFTIETTVDPAKRGSIYTKIGNLLAKDNMSKLIWLAPEEITSHSEDALFHALEEIFRKQIIAVSIHERYVRMGDLHALIPIGVIMHPIDPVTEKTLYTFSAIKTTPAYGRMSNELVGYDVGTVRNTLFTECCSLLYSTTSFDGVGGLEQQYNDTLKGQNGGTLIIKDHSGKTVTILAEKKKHEGKDVTLDW